MSVTPTGAPAWVRTTSFEDYGGHEDKRDYMNVGAVNARTDVSAAEFSRMVSDVAAVAHTAPMWVLTVLCNDGSPAAPTVEVALGMTGVRMTSYAGASPPSGFPTLARNGDGDFTITFDATYSDDYGVAGAWVPLNATATVQASTAVHRLATTIISGSTVRVRIFNDSGSAVADQRVSVSVT
jgi:hypothetical protein